MSAHSIMSVSMLSGKGTGKGKDPKWRNWAARFIEPEILESADAEQMRRNLREIALVNRIFGGHGVARRLFGEVATPSQPFTLLDVGAASGDMGAAVLRAFPRATVISLDLSPLHLAPQRGPCVAADAFHLPFAARSVDFVFCSLFLHHFEDGEVIALLSEFGRLARRAVLAIDLDRSRAAYYFLPATRWLFHWDSIMLHDGPVSVRSSFRRDELLSLARRAGLAQARVRRHHPWFRLSLSAPVPPAQKH